MRLPPELALPRRIYPKDHEAIELFYLAKILPRELAVHRRTHQSLPTYASTIHTLGQNIEAPVITAPSSGPGASTSWPPRPRPPSPKRVSWMGSSAPCSS